MTAGVFRSNLAQATQGLVYVCILRSCLFDSAALCCNIAGENTVNTMRPISSELADSSKKLKELVSEGKLHIEGSTINDLTTLATILGI